MRVDELMRYSRAFYPAWDDGYAEELRQAFALDPAAKIRNLSRGQRARAGLLIALAHRPELLVLDEPSSGLDPIVRRDILGAVIRTIAHEGRTVLFSSHLLEEVERVADHVTMIHQGKIVLSAPLDDIRESNRVGERVPSLDEIFVAHVGRDAALAPEAELVRSPALAIAWEFRRRHRWGLIAVAGYLFVVATIRFLILEPGEPVLVDSVRFAALVSVPLTTTLVYLLAVFSFGFAGDLAARPP